MLDTSRYHEYKFIVDGKWQHDETAPFMPDPLGNVNNWMFVRRIDPSTSQPSCFESADLVARQQRELVSVVTTAISSPTSSMTGQLSKGDAEDGRQVTIAPTVLNPREPVGEIKMKICDNMMSRA